MQKRKLGFVFAKKLQKSMKIYIHKFTTGKLLKHTDFIFTSLEHSKTFTTHDDVARELMNEHFGIENTPNNIHEFVADRLFSNDVNFKEISSRELKHAVCQQASNKAPGPDNLDPIIVKYLCNSFSALIIAILIKCLSVGHFLVFENGVWIVL